MDNPVGPIFVAGCPRSGTSALSWAIAEHPGYWTSAETHFFYYLLRDDNSWIRHAFEKSTSDGSWLKKHEVGFQQFLLYLGLGLDRMMRAKADGRQWVDGSPENALVGAALLDMFPTAQIILVMRDPRSVCLSMLTSGFPFAWANDLQAAIREWNFYAGVTKTLVAAHPGQVVVVKNEDMRGRPDRVATQIGERLRLRSPDIVRDFLATRTVNSSFDKSSYAPDSPFRSEAPPAVSRDQFFHEHGDYILRETAELSSAHGYR